MKSTTTYKIFVAGPSDVALEIEIIRETISDISTLTKGIGLSFETFYWAEDATPGMAKETQARINEQADGYDAFLAVLGSKIGTPTKSFESGTIEEIESAIKNSDTSHFKLDSVMVFFKEVTVNARDPNLKSLLQIQDFRHSLGQRGVFFKDFSDEADLRQSILKSFSHLIKKCLDITSDNLDTNITSFEKDEEIEDSAIITDPIDNDLGIMELDTLIAELMNIATEKSEILTNSISELGNKTEIHTKELERATELGDITLGKHIFSEIAAGMNQCAEIIRETTPIIRSSFTEAMSYTRQLIEIRFDDTPEDGDDTSNTGTIEAISGTLEAAENNVTSFEKFLLSVQIMPRMTKEINIAKRTLISEASSLISMFEFIHKECQDIVRFYDGLKDSRV
jgi:hypothetical protein